MSEVELSKRLSTVNESGSGTGSAAGSRVTSPGSSNRESRADSEQGILDSEGNAVSPQGTLQSKSLSPLHSDDSVCT